MIKHSQSIISLAWFLFPSLAPNPPPPSLPQMGLGSFLCLPSYKHVPFGGGARYIVPMLSREGGEGCSPAIPAAIFN